MDSPLALSGSDTENEVEIDDSNKENSSPQDQKEILDITSDETVIIDPENPAEMNGELRTVKIEKRTSPQNLQDAFSAICELSKEEEDYVEENFNVLLRKLDECTMRCTACYCQIHLNRDDEVYAHPALRVLVCKKCRNFYADGVFNQDEDGLDEYCRWCANGGELFMCDFCTNGFCKQCIKRNLGRAAVEEATAKKWKCFVCDIKPLKNLRALYQVVQLQLDKKQIKKKDSSRSEKFSKNLQNKFSNLKLERKKLKKEALEIKKEDETSDVEKYLDDVESLSIIFTGQIRKIKKRLETKVLDDDKSKKKFVKLVDAMKNNLNIILKHLNGEQVDYPKAENENPLKMEDSKTSSPESMVKHSKKVNPIKSFNDGDETNASSPMISDEPPLSADEEKRNGTPCLSVPSSPTSDTSKRRRSSDSSLVHENSKRRKTGSASDADDPLAISSCDNTDAKQSLLSSSSENDLTDNECDKKKITKTAESDQAKICVTKINKDVMNKLDNVGYVSSEDVQSIESKDVDQSHKLQTRRHDSLECLLREIENEPAKSRIVSDTSSSSDELCQVQVENRRKSKKLHKKKLSRDKSESSSDDDEVDVKEAVELDVPCGKSMDNSMLDIMKQSLLETSDEFEYESEDSDVKVPSGRKVYKKKVSPVKKLQRERPKGYVSMKFSSEESSNSNSEDLSSSSSSVDGRESGKESRQSSDTEVLSSDLSEASSVEFGGNFKANKSKRIVRMEESSSDSTDDDDGKLNTSTPRKHRKIIRDEDLQKSTKEATQEEEERRKRIAQRLEEYQKFFETQRKKDMPEELVLDYDKNTKEPLVVVDASVTAKLKPHQWKGIQFMWNATIESVERLANNCKGGGCILAHCMGLGKTLQVIALVHSILSNKMVSERIQRILICAPVNTIRNWMAEFRKWIGSKAEYDVSHLSSAEDFDERSFKLCEWYDEGGVMIIGYDMFRILTSEKNKKIKEKLKNNFQKCLVDPGADLIICDEGHIIKNEKSALSNALKKIATKRRIVLTGTPLQNNLNEYHCMVQFVKLNLLGSKKEFANRFINPIEQGQSVDAMPREVKRMKRRAHILHELLDGCVQRLDYSVLKPYLLPKFEYVLLVQMSEDQIKLYSHYLNTFTARGEQKEAGARLFNDFSALFKIWNHPMILYNQMAKIENDDDGFLDDTSSSSESEESKKEKDNEDNDQRSDWWLKVMGWKDDENLKENLTKLELSGKMVLLMDILTKCTLAGDKVIVFSHSLKCLDMIEYFLHEISQGNLAMCNSKVTLPPHLRKWHVNKDYVRLDGSVDMRVREKQCKSFNKPTNERLRLFLISTRAGGIGTNLTGANRVVIFDIGWNPAHDTQSLFRIYRFGQTKPSYIYRLVSQGTMEEKIYSRQVAKLSTSRRVVDEHQIKRYYKTADLKELYQFQPADPGIRETPIKPDDTIFAELLLEHAQWIVNYHEHDSLLEHQSHEQLTEEERKAAWEDFENEKKGYLPPAAVSQANRNFGNVVLTNDELSLLGPFLQGEPYQFKVLLEKVKQRFPKLDITKIFSISVHYTRRALLFHQNQYALMMAGNKNPPGDLIYQESINKEIKKILENIHREHKIISQYGTVLPKSNLATNQVLEKMNRGGENRREAQTPILLDLEDPEPSTSKIEGAKEMTKPKSASSKQNPEPIVLD